MIDFWPEDVTLRGMPLVGTLGHLEREHAAAWIVLALARRGYGWLPVHVSDLLDAIDVMAPSWRRNPVFRPDFSELVTSGDAIEIGPGWIALTPTAIEKLRPYARPG